MKKLIMAAAAITAGFAMADVVSSDIVGYIKNDKTGKQYVTVGFGFLGIGSGEGKTFQLDDIKPTSWDSGSDILQVMSSVNARTLEMYSYVSAEEADGDTDIIGWWDGDISEMLGDTEFDLGQGFKGNFAAKDVAINDAGKVNKDITEVDYTGKQYVAVANILPRAIMLGEIVGVGTDSGSDILQILSTENAKTLEMFAYVSAEEADGDADIVGWWDGDISEKKNTQEIEAGGAMWANFAAKSAKLVFPSATATPVEVTND